MATKTILIVEDDRAISEDLKLLLTSEGYDVLNAHNGEEALQLLRSRPEIPNAVLLDIMMPVMDGWQFREKQTQDARLAEIPIIVMTADGHAAQKAAKMKAQGWVQKPVDVDRLLAEVQKNCSA